MTPQNSPTVLICFCPCNTRAAETRMSRSRPDIRYAAAEPRDQGGGVACLRFSFSWLAGLGLASCVPASCTKRLQHSTTAKTRRKQTLTHSHTPLFLSRTDVKFYLWMY